MAPHSPTDASVHGSTILDAVLREAFGRVVYTHKAHEKEADILLARLSKIKLGQILLPVVSTGGFITVFFGTGWWGSAVGGLCSAALLALNLYTRDYDLGRQAQEHRDSATRIWSIREKHLSLIADLAIGNKSLLDIQRKRDVLEDELSKVYSESPSTSEGAYKKAQKALKFEEEMTFSITEVDAFLPQELRRTQ